MSDAFDVNRDAIVAVSYPPLTLPTTTSVYILLVALS